MGPCLPVDNRAKSCLLDSVLFSQTQNRPRTRRVFFEDISNLPIREHNSASVLAVMLSALCNHIGNIVSLRPKK